MNYLGIDIGGMSIKIGLVNEKGEILTKEAYVTDTSSKENFSTCLIKSIKEFMNKNSLTSDNVYGIGVGCPGTINSKTSTIIFAPNINIPNLALADLIESNIKIQTKVVNDADAAALGEAKFGIGKKYKNSIMITLGTGVGGGIILNGKLYTGANYLGTELGHTVIRYNGVKCGCGRKGCLEAYASATALIRQTKEAIAKHPESSMVEYCKEHSGEVSGRTAFVCAKEGDKVAKAVVERYIDYLTCGLINFTNIFRPDCFILGGGISKERDYLTSRILKRFKKDKNNFPNDSYPVVASAVLGNDAGIIGGASLFMK